MVDVPLRADLRLKVLERILNGKLSPGVRVNESRLAKELGVSRTPLREALFQLEREGFVRSDRDRGFSVEPMSAREIRELYPMLWTLARVSRTSVVRPSCDACRSFAYPTQQRVAQYAQPKARSRSGQ
jgi:DNA-binding FadR family transcriptional regulator